MSDELSKQIQAIDKLLKKEENKLCADCRRKSPSWASITVGVFMCIKCAGTFRIMKVFIES
jgi:ribosomal protein L37AE/L43A